jgi:hypothetical protein
MLTYLTKCLILCKKTIMKWKVKVKVTLRLTVSQSVSLGVELQYLLLFDSYGLIFVGRPLWREDGSVFYICCWSLPAQSFLGASPLGLAAIFYCLRSATSLFFASYGSQGHGGGIHRKVAGSSPAEVDFFNWPNPSSRTMALGSTQPLTVLSTRNLPGR